MILNVDANDVKWVVLQTVKPKFVSSVGVTPSELQIFFVLSQKTQEDEKAKTDRFTSCFSLLFVIFMECFSDIFNSLFNKNNFYYSNYDVRSGCKLVITLI